jgi:TldD protein
MLDRLRSALSGRDSSVSYAEIRFQSRTVSEVAFVNGELDRIRAVESSGSGIRVLSGGSWGFAATSDSALSSLRKALSDSVSLARVISERPGGIRSRKLAECKMEKGRFSPPVNGELCSVDMEQKVAVTRQAEAAAKKHSKAIRTSSCTYREIIDYKAIVNTDGAELEIFDSKPEFNVSAVAKLNGETATASEGLGITGGWVDLFDKKSHLDYAYEAAEKAEKLAAAKYPPGEKTSIILDPGMVGLLCHEAIGHTVEADFVLSGSVASKRLGQPVASAGVTLVDSGSSDLAKNAGGSIAVDDEGVAASRVPIIEKGELVSYLHNRETAQEFGVRPTGNARAFGYSDEPLIRMRNTYIEPGNSDLDEIIKETHHGYLVRGARNGQADANGEFMFGAQEAYLIEAGELKTLFKGASISGSAFEVLGSIDMLGSRFEYDMGAGYCGKYQPAKVDGGGPYLRCTAVIGGLQG